MRTYTTALRASWLAAAVVAFIAGCGGSPEDSGGSVIHLGRKHPKAKPVAADVSGEIPLTAMVSAVSVAKSGANVALKFSLLQKPEVGQPLDMDVALVPGGLFDSVSMELQPGEGLELLDNNTSRSFDKPAEAKPIHVHVRVLPRRDGIFTLSANVATVAADAAREASTRTFAIPVIAGEGLPELAAKPEGSKGL